MHRVTALIVGIGLLALAGAGCGRAPAATHSEHARSDYLLDSEPAGALEVLDAKEQAKDGEPIVLVGRLGGGLKPWIDGRAAFLVVDTRILPSCEDGEQCDADCPDCAREMASASTMIKVVGNDGRVLPVDARELLGVQELDTVVIRGVASRDKSGNVTIAADGVFVRR